MQQYFTRIVDLLGGCLTVKN